MKISYLTKPKAPDDLYGLYKDLRWADMLDLTKEQLDTAMNNSAFVVYAYEGDKLTGTGRILTDGALHTYLCGLGVLEEYRGKGIGAEITRKLSLYCSENGLRLQLLCEENLVPYYKKMGFDSFSVGMKKQP